jgi:predicted Ser/Thr protein kinase
VLTGQQVGPFQVEKLLGRGAMGAVYRARHTETSVLVALKFLAPGLGANPGVLARFEREAAILKQLQHPNIVRLIATGKVQKTPFMVMEYIEGKDLQQVLRHHGPFLWEEVVEFGKHICAALQHAHDKGVIHRDLKPSNLMIMEDGTIKLTDFGIAKDLDVTGLTADHHTLGTAAYMSPEQCRGERTLTAKSDLYSLGVVLYELLTGKKPFEAENTLAMLRQHNEAKFTRPGKVVLNTPVWLDTLICHLLEKKPERRPKDARIVAQALSEVQEKIATLHSAGTDAASKTLRKSRDVEEKEAARALLAAKRKGPKKAGPAGIRWHVWYQAAGLAALLLVVVSLVVYALWPAGPAERYERGLRLVQRGDELVDQGDIDGALVKWYDAEHQYLTKLAEDPGNPYAEKAQEQLAYMKAGTLYTRGNRRLSEGNWKEALAKGYDELLDKYPAGNKYVEKARAGIQPFESTDLLETGRKLADADKRGTWPRARAALERLVKRYPKSEATAEAQAILDRLAVHRKALDELEEAKRTGRPPAVSYVPEALALQALALEQQEKPDEARAKWEELKALRTKPAFRNDRDARPWILLAEEKLRSKEA